MDRMFEVGDHWVLATAVFGGRSRTSYSDFRAILNEEIAPALHAVVPYNFPALHHKCYPLQFGDVS